MNTITKISPRPLALLIATALSGNAFAADDVLNDGETMVVQATAEEALKQRPGSGSLRFRGGRWRGEHHHQTADE